MSKHSRLTVFAVIAVNLSMLGFAALTRIQEDVAPAPDSPASGSGVSGLFAVSAERYVAVGSIRIPRINLDTPFFMGVHDEVVNLGPGLWPGTPLPGDPGNAVIAGHRTTHTRPFLDLDRLRSGDAIEVAMAGKLAATFRVVSTHVVAESDYVDSVLSQPEPSETSMVTLFACTPKGQRTHRIVVRALRAG